MVPNWSTVVSGGPKRSTSAVVRSVRACSRMAPAPARANPSGPITDSSSDATSRCNCSRDCSSSPGNGGARLAAGLPELRRALFPQRLAATGQDEVGPLAEQQRPVEQGLLDGGCPLPDQGA